MKNIQHLIFFLSTLGIVFIFSCTPKVTEEVKAPEVVKPTVDISKEPDNPCTTLKDLSPSDRNDAETAYVLYKDQVKQKNFEAALPLWEKAYGLAPAANGSIKYQFEDGIKIYKHFYDQATDDASKSAFLDSIIAIYDKRVECYPGDAATVKARKGFDFYYYYSGHAPKDESYKLFKETIDAKGEKTDYYVVNPMTKLLFDKVVAKEISLEEGRKYAMALLDILDYGTKSGKNVEAWDIVNDYAPSRLESLEGVEGFYGCDYYSNKYYAYFQSNPTDCDVIKKSYGRLLWGKCDVNNPMVQEIKAAKTKNCYTPPPPEGPLKIAFNAYNEGKYNEAVKLFEDFVNLTSDMNKKAKYTLLIAKIYYGDIKNFPQARKYAMKATEYRSNWGDPYLLIGKLYASSGPLCGPGRGWDSQVVTWPAIDMFEKAKAVDSAAAEEANKWINQYKKYMPSKEDIFSRSLSAGASYKVGCWINRSTKIRTSD